LGEAAAVGVDVEFADLVDVGGQGRGEVGTELGVDRGAVGFHLLELAVRRTEVPGDDRVGQRRMVHYKVSRAFSGPLVAYRYRSDKAGYVSISRLNTRQVDRSSLSRCYAAEVGGGIILPDLCCAGTVQVS
jgi:hypothetical protein